MSFPNVPNPYPPGWNDPPKDIFTKNGATSNGDLNSTNGAVSWDQVVSDVEQLLQDCSIVVQSAGPMQTKMLDDARKKLTPLLDRLRSHDPKLEPLLSDLHSVTQSLHGKDFPGATKGITRFMTEIYSHDAVNNQWVLGLKRLPDIMKAVQ